jgi:hypothetical protein
MSLIELKNIYLQKIKIKMNIKIDQFHTSKIGNFRYIISNTIINILGYDTKFITYLIKYFSFSFSFSFLVKILTNTLETKKQVITY